MLSLVLVATLTACGSGSEHGLTNVNTPVAPPVFKATSVSNALEHGVSRGLDGIWVYVDDGSGALTVFTAGVENRVSLAPADSATLFKIASVSKMFIAASVIRAQTHGLISLDDTLAYWLPEVADRIDQSADITLRHLLLHRSGVRDFDSEPGFSWSRNYGLQALLEFVYDKPADFNPGARYAYSNTNYLLLGLLLDTALGYSHHDFVRNEITAPLGLTNTFSLLADTDPLLLAKGYWDDVDRSSLDYLAPGGSMISTVSEVGVFLRALADQTLLNAEEQAIFASLFGIGHSGWLPGYQSLAYYHRDINTVLVQFVNTTGRNSEQVSQEVYDSILSFLGSQSP